MLSRNATACRRARDSASIARDPVTEPARTDTLPGATLIDPLAVVAANLRSLRRQRGLSQEALAQASGIHSSEVSRIERAVREPRLLTVVRIARALDVPVGGLLEGMR